MNKDHRDAEKTERGGRDWRRMHHSPLFWLCLLLCLAAIATYVLTDDLSWRPQIH
jgi:hypothetical protein